MYLEHLEPHENSSPTQTTPKAVKASRAVYAIDDPRQTAIQGVFGTYAGGKGCEKITTRWSLGAVSASTPKLGSSTPSPERNRVASKTHEPLGSLRSTTIEDSTGKRNIRRGGGGTNSVHGVVPPKKRCTKQKPQCRAFHTGIVWFAS